MTAVLDVVTSVLMVPFGLGGAIGLVEAFLRWNSRPRRHVCVENLENVQYKLCVEENGKREWVLIPAQDLPTVFSWFYRMDNDSPIELSFHSYVDPALNCHLTVPPWATRKMKRLLRKHRRSWSPAHFFSHPQKQGPYR